MPKTVTIKYNPSPKQNEFHASTAFETALIGGRGAAKTWAGCMEGYVLSKEYPGNIGLIVRKQMTNLIPTTLMSFRKLIPAECYHINEQKHIITVFTGVKDELGNPINSIIHYAGLDDQESIKKYRGMELGWILFDQAEECDENDISELIPCLRHKLPDGSLPRYRVLYLANPQKSYIVAKFTQNITPKMELIQVSTFDNPYRTPGYIEMLQELYKDRPERYKAMVEGKLDVMSESNSLMKYEKLMYCSSVGQRHIKAHITSKGVSCDSARYGDDLTIIYGWEGTKIIKAKVLADQSVPAVAAECVAMCKEIGGNWIAIDTTAGIGAGSFDVMKQLLSDTSYIKLYGVNSSESIKGSKYLNVRAEMYHVLAEYVNNNLITLPNDPLLIAELAIQTYEYHIDKIKITSKDIMKNDLGRSPDRGDACAIGIYAIAKLIVDAESEPQYRDDRPLVYRRENTELSIDNTNPYDDGSLTEE